MICPVYIRKTEEGLEGVEIILTGTGRKIIAISHKYLHLSIHKFRYKNVNSLLHKLNGPLLHLDVVDMSYSWGMSFGGGSIWTSTSTNSNMYWSDFDVPEELPEPDLTVESEFIRKLKLNPEDRVFVRALFERIIKRTPKNPSRGSKDPFKYMKRYHGRK